MLICQVGLFLTAATLLVVFETVSTSKEAMININSVKWLHLVHDKFLSLTLHPRHLLFSEKFGIESTNMARGLAPAFIRVGGPESDLLQFTNTAGLDKKIAVSESQWKGLNKFVTDCNLDLIVCLNPLQRVNGVWDSRSTLELISMSNRNGYNLTWQLGFETQKLKHLDEGVSGAELGRDIVRLRKILDSFPRYKESDIIGPDITSMKNYEDIKFIKDYLMESGSALNAITWHPQFSEVNADEEDVLQALSMVYNGLDALLYGKDQIPKASQYITEKPMWIAESQSGCYANEFSDALIWIRRLGTAARLGFYVFMHHIKETAFNHPTPDFWVSLLYKNLVGRAVLDTRIISGNRSSLQVFSHCTAVEEIPINPIIAEDFEYERGSITVFGSNSLNEQIKLSLTSLVKNEKVHIYILTGGGAARPRTTLLNGQELTLSPSGDLPVILPKVRTTNRNLVYTIPSKSVFFIVFPEARVRTCSTYPGTIVVENNNIMKRLKQGKNSNDIQESIENTLVRGESNEYKSSELSPKETYVKFINKNSEGESQVNPVRTIRGRSNGVSSGQKYNIGKGKTSILKNKSNKYLSNNNEQITLPKQEDIAMANVKYVTYSDSSWLPKFTETNYSEGATEDIIQTLNSTFNGFIDHANSTLKTLHNLDTNERRNKYTVLANAIFGKRNVSSSEVNSISETGKEGFKINRRKRYTGNEISFGTPKPQYLNQNPIVPQSEHLSYPIYHMPISKQDKQTLNNLPINTFEADRHTFGIMLENQDLFPMEDLHVKVEGNVFDTANEEHIDSRDMYQKHLDLSVEGIRQFNGHDHGEFKNLNSKPKVNVKDSVKHMGELLEAEYDVMSRTIENKIKLPEKNSFSIEVVSEKCCNDTHDKEVNKLVSKQFLTHYKISNDKNLQQESDYDDNKEGDVKKKEKAVPSSLLKKQVDFKQNKMKNEAWDSDSISFVSWETPRIATEDYEVSKYGNNKYKSTRRVRRASNEEKPIHTDEMEDISTNHMSNETDKSYLDKSEEDQLTQLLREITDDGEQLLHVLAKEQKELEQRENNSTINEAYEHHMFDITDKNLLNTSTENVLFTGVMNNSVTPESLGYKNLNLEIEYPVTMYDSSSNLTSIFVKNNAIERKAVFPEMKRKDLNLNIKEELQNSSSNVSESHNLRNPRKLDIDIVNKNKNNIALNVNNSQLQMQMENSDMDIDTELRDEKSFDKVKTINVDRNEDTNVKQIGGLTDEENTYITTISPLVSSIASEIQSGTNRVLKNDSTTEISMVPGNIIMQISTTRSNILPLPLPTIAKKEIKPKNLPIEETVNNNFISQNKSETMKKQQLLQDRANRPKRRNEQIELLRSRLVAYREHLNELTKKRLKHKREIDINYYNKNHIFKKDSPYVSERVLNNQKISNELNHISNIPTSVHSNSELDILPEPNTSKQVGDKVIAQTENPTRYTDIHKYNEYISVKLPTKRSFNAIQTRHIINKIDNSYQYNYDNNNKNKISSKEQESGNYVFKNTSPLKQNLLEKYGKSSAENFSGENVNENKEIINRGNFKFYDSTGNNNTFGHKRSQTGNYNNKNLLQNVITETNNREQSKPEFSNRSFVRRRRSIRPEIYKKISPRSARYIGYKHKIPSENNYNFRSGFKMNKINKLFSQHKRSLDDFATNSIKNSIDYWLSTNEVSKEKISRSYIPLILYNDKILDAFPKYEYDSELGDNSVTKIKNIVNQYKKAKPNIVHTFLNYDTSHDLKNKDMSVVAAEFETTDKSDLQKEKNNSVINTEKENSFNGNKSVNETKELSNRSFGDLIQNAFIFFINRIKNMFIK